MFHDARQLRHGIGFDRARTGSRNLAWRDHLIKFCSVASIQRRGRWAVDSSARICLINKFPKEWPSLGEDIQQNFQCYYLSGSVPPAMQLLKRILQGKFLSLFGGMANPAKHTAKNGRIAAVVDFKFSPLNDLGKHSRHSIASQLE